MSGNLILVGTPIGNLEDISHRALRTLREADIIACEDVRRTRKLLAHYEISSRELVVYNEGNERRQSKRLLERIAKGKKLALVADAGMPGMSDPGYRLVRACIEAEIPVGVVPGPTAVVSALTVSGLAPGRFVFEGFLPRKAGERRRRIGELAQDPRTLVLFESPHRIEDCLVDLVAGLGDRPAALARELTKLHEEVRRASLLELLEGVRGRPVRGEIVLMIAGAVGEHRQEVSSFELAQRARALIDEGVERSDAMSRVARETGVPRRRVFDALLEDSS